MKWKIALGVIPLGLAIPFVLGLGSDEAGPIRAPNHVYVERALGYHLMAPTRLPRGMQPGLNGVQRGSNRILCDYVNETETLIVAQERRTPERDAYNRDYFAGQKVEVNGHEGTLTTGKIGERRLAFFTPELTVILSSTALTDRELHDVASSMQ
jgi:hypothetical protein